MAQRERIACGETVQRADKAGPRGREGRRACARGRLVPTERPHRAEGEEEGARAGRNCR
jgi:hypothetical protein